MNDVEAARAQGDLFAQRAYDKAERKEPSFGDRARKFVVAYLEQHGPTSGEILVNNCKRSGVTPDDDRAFGGVFQKLQRDGAIHIVGTCTRFKGHGTAGARIWALTNKEP